LGENVDSAILNQLHRIRAVGIGHPDAFFFNAFEIGKIGFKLLASTNLQVSPVGLSFFVDRDGGLT